MNDQMIATLLQYIKDHIEDDRSNFASLNTKTTRIDENVQSLLQTRSYHSGVSRAAMWLVGIVGTITATFLSAAITWAFRSH